MDAPSCVFKTEFRHENKCSAPELPTIISQQKISAKKIQTVVKQSSQENYPEKAANGRGNNARSGENTPLYKLTQTEQFISEIHETNMKIMEAIEIQDKLIEKIYRKKTRNTSFTHGKLRLIHNFTTMVIVIILLIQSFNAMPIDRPALFDKHERMDKLIMKNHIGYHFKKVVREVSQELFV